MKRSVREGAFFKYQGTKDKGTKYQVRSEKKATTIAYVAFFLYLCTDFWN